MHPQIVLGCIAILSLELGRDGRFLAVSANRSLTQTSGAKRPSFAPPAASKDSFRCSAAKYV